MMSNHKIPSPPSLPGRASSPFSLTSCILPAIGLATLFLCIASAIAGYLLFSAPPSKPFVLINSPRNGARIAAGDELFIHAIARSDQKIKRVELWVDGILQDAQASNLAGGTSPFPFTINWQSPPTGRHTITVRAYDMRNTRGHTSISIETIASSDRDQDGVLDDVDGCLNQPGPAENRGCPAPTPDDRDGDGIANSIDACPDQPGTLVADGCPDADGDGVRDSADACPREFGVPDARGCLSANDTDSDGVPNTSDTCPNDPGPAENNGCPSRDAELVSDRDGDGVRDSHDLCPATPGPASNSGCPPTGAGDSDRDGVDDATDLAPTEPGSADSGGAPPPGGGSDSDGDSIADDEESSHSADESFPDAGGWEAINLVRIEALEFSVTQDYDQVYCYVTSRNVAERYGPFELIGTKQWDIAEYLGGANSRTLGVPVGDALSLHVECSGHYPAEGPISIAPADLGSITRTYTQDKWDGHVITERSGMAVGERGTAGHSFEVKFRLCLRSCESAAFPPPILRRTRVSIGPFISIPFLDWTFSGNESDITGYRLYINDNRRDSIPAIGRNRVRLSHYTPPCGETYEYYVTAYRARADGFNDRESPPSNIINVEGEPCPRRIRVTFSRAYLAPNFPDDWGLDGGPHYGSFWATGIREQRLEFRDGECHSFLWIYSCRGWEYRFEGNVQTIFEGIRATGPELSGWNMYAPEVNYVIVELGRNDDLTIGANIMDEDVYSHDDTLLNARHTFSAGETLPAEVELKSGNNWVRVQVAIIPGGNPSAASDVNLKSNIVAVNPREVLTRLRQLPISTWKYKSDDPSVQHIGPMAQDFYDTFGVGETDTHIAQVDADGVAFAAIQGLYDEFQEKNVRIAVLEEKNRSLETRIESLERRLDEQISAIQSVPCESTLVWLAMGAAIGIGLARTIRF